MFTPELTQPPTVPPDEHLLDIQPDLFDDGSYGIELANLDKPETKHGKYTGAALECRQVVCQRVLELLAEDMGVNIIAEKLRGEGIKIGPRSILAFKRRKPELVATEKRKLSDQLSGISKLMADNIENRLINGTMKPSPLDLAIIIDKKAALDGDAGLIIEHRVMVASAADFTKRLDEVRRAKCLGPPVECESTASDVIPQ